MSQRSSGWQLWTARIFAIVLCVFLSAFALDAFQPGRPLAEAVPDFAAHLVPTLVLAGVVALSWRWEWIGALVFTGLAFAYAYVSHDKPSWALAVALPLFAAGLLYGWSWRRRSGHGLHPGRGSPVA